jgi:hypothetical protein
MFELKVSVRPAILEVIVPPEEIVVVLFRSITLSVVSSAAPFQMIVPALVPAPSWMVAFVPKTLF